MFAIVGCNGTILVWFERRHGFQYVNTVGLCSKIAADCLHDV